MQPYYPNDNTHKHKKEKDIDKFLFNAEKKRAKELVQKVKHYEKIVDIKLATKRERKELISSNEKVIIEKDDDNDLVTKTCTTNTSVSEISISKQEKETEPEFNIKFAIEKIIKHLEKPGALQKCLNLLKQLLIHIENIKPLVLVKIFYTISGLPFKFNDGTITKNIVDLFEFVKNEIDRLNYQNEKYFKDNNVKDIFDLFTIPFKHQVNLITDDSFKFNEGIKNLEKNLFSSGIALSLSDYNEEELKELNKFEKLLGLKEEDKNDNLNENADNKFDIYEDNSLDNSENENLLKHFNIDPYYLIEGIKRNFLFDNLKQAFGYHKHKWASSSVNSLFTRLYLEKNKLNPTQIDQLESMINIIKNKSNSIYTIEQNAALRDEKIKHNPLQAYHNVSDARVEKLVDSSLDRWEAKQSGLTYGKMFINN